MANWNYDALIRDGWTWNAQRNGYERPKTIGAGVGGTTFVPYYQEPTTTATSGVTSAAQTLARGGVSTTVAAPRIQAPAASGPAQVGRTQGVSMPIMGVPVQVGRAPTVTAQTVDGSLGSFELPDWNVGDVEAGTVDPFAIADRDVLRELERQASEELGLGGKLSAQEERLAQQSARAAFAARGMAYGNPGAVAEVMARDQYARNRQADRRTFAQGVAGMLSTADQAEAERADRVALANQSAGLEAARANQAAGISRWTTEGQAAQAQAQTRLQVALANQEAKLRADLANASSEGDRARLQAQLNETVAARNQAAQLQVGLANASSEGERARLQAQLDEAAAARNQGAQLQVGQGNANLALQAAQGNQNAGLQMLQLGYQDLWNQRGNAGTWSITPQGGQTNQILTAQRTAANQAAGRPMDAGQYVDIYGVTRWTSGPRRLGT